MHAKQVDVAAMDGDCVRDAPHVEGVDAAASARHREVKVRLHHREGAVFVHADGLDIRLGGRDAQRVRAIPDCDGVYAR